ncbi:type II secretion system F family protein [Hellea balneolensis]|uniref:type II secretion system F family protein n=1 Tax=Hellea balneolensis TaxID=287478 RepID=UPI00040C2D68|nr:type II secretion system F family protein [Hellea balneolensis]
MLSFTNSLTIIVALSFLAISIGLMFLAARNAFNHNRQLNKRLVSSNDADIENIGLKPKRKWLSRMGDHLTLPGAEEITRIRSELAKAGYYDEAAVKTFYAIRVISLFGPQLILLLCWSLVWENMGAKKIILLASTLAVSGLLGPNMFIRWKQKRRTLRCKEGFPDMTDLMVACIEAGLGLDAALMRVSNELGGRYPALKVNLEIMNLELRAGRERHKAMMNFAERIGLEEAKALAIMLRQAEEMGSSMGAALRTFSDDMRTKRMLLAEEKAMALSAKLTIPLIVFIFPTLMVMLLLPAGIRLAETLS